MNLYVYYDVDPRESEALVSDVRAMQRTLHGAPRLVKRPEPADRETWMEIYEDVDASFEARLAAAAATVDWRGAGRRHVERFVDC